MLKEEKKFDQFGQKLFMQGTLQEFEKKNGPIKAEWQLLRVKFRLKC